VKRHLLLTASLVFASFTTGTAAQTPPSASTPASPTAKPAARVEAPPDPTMQAEQGTPLKLQFVISKYQGEKKISSVPYVLSVNANQRRGTSLRMGGQVPIPRADNGPLYRDIGMNIDVAAYTATGQAFRVEIALEESSVFTSEKAGAVASGPPAFRSFKTTNSIVLKDGQTLQVASAADPVSGDVVRVDLTLTVVK
jgi:hypothetical protein